MNELLVEYKELRNDVSVMMGMALADQDLDLTDPKQITAITMVKKTMAFSDKLFKAQIDMMEKIDKIYEELTTKK